jgi:hypothetical protein
MVRLRLPGLRRRRRNLLAHDHAADTRLVKSDAGTGKVIGSMTASSIYEKLDITTERELFLQVFQQYRLS